MRPRRVVSRDLRCVALAEQPLHYVLVRRHGKRGVGLKVDESGLTVSAPSTMPLARIEALVRESEGWVLRKVAEWSARRVPAATWEDGASLPFLGSFLTLRIAIGTRKMVGRVGDELRVVVRDPSRESIARAAIEWYKRSALEHFGARLAALAVAGGVARPTLHLSPARSRWGSCNTRREVRLAWRLVKAPPALVDYVICHELAHLRHMNHSAAFWREVERLCPEYRRHRAALRELDAACRTF